MPNWCQNVVYINHENTDLIDDLKDKIDTDKEKFFEYILPRPSSEDENWYDWNLSNWGTKWEVSPSEYWINEDGALYVSFDSAWGPPTVLYEYMYEKGYDVEAFYNEEGMAFCGWFIDGEDNYYEYGNLSADEIEDQIPTRVDEMFCISQYKRDNEEFEEEDTFVFSEEEPVECYSCGEEHLESELPEMSGQYICPSCGEGWVLKELREETEFDTEEEDKEPNWELMYGLTEWFNKKTKPVHVGIYELKTNKKWPFPATIKVEWDGKKWNTEEKFTAWRGLAEDPVAKEIALAKALEELKEEFEKLMAEEDKE